MILMQNIGKGRWDVGVFQRNDTLLMIPVFLQHVDTEKFLHVSANHEFMHPLNGHMEVSCVEDGNEDALWHSREGIYFQETKL